MKQTYTDIRNSTAFGGVFLLSLKINILPQKWPVTITMIDNFPKKWQFTQNMIIYMRDGDDRMNLTKKWKDIGDQVYGDVAGGKENPSLIFILMMITVMVMVATKM